MKNTVIINAVVLCVVISSFFASGCIIIDKMPRPDFWPPNGHFETTTHWNGFIPMNSLQQLSEVYNTQELLVFQRKGFRPYLKVVGESTVELNFIDAVHMDTIQIWSTLIAGPYRWDRLKSISAAINTDEILLLIKYPSDVKGGDPFLGASRYYIKIYKPKEGGLIIRKGYRFIGLVFMLFPTILHDSTWHHYEADL